MRMSIRIDRGREARGLVDRLQPVGGLGDELHVALAIEQHAEARAHERLVVGHEHPDHGRPPLDRQPGVEDEAARLLPGPADISPP